MKLNNFYKNSIQGDSILIKYFEALGVETKFIENKIVLTKIKDFSYPKKLNLNLIDSPDLAQTIAVTCFGLQSVLLILEMYFFRICVWSSIFDTHTHVGKKAF